MRMQHPGRYAFSLMESAADAVVKLLLEREFDDGDPAWEDPTECGGAF